MSRQACFWVGTGRHVLLGLIVLGSFAGESRAQPLGPEIAAPTNFDRFGDALPEDVVRRYGSLRFRHAGGHKSISELAFSPDGKQIASVGPDHTVRVWDLDGRELMRFAGNKNDEFSSVTLSPDGTRLAAHGDNELRVWDVASGELVMQIVGGRGSSPVFSADSKRVAATKLFYTPMGGYLDRSFRVWDIASGELLRSLDSSKRLLWPLAIALDSGVTASHDEKGVKIRRLDSGKTVCTYNKHFIHGKHGLHNEHTAGVPSVAFACDGKTAASSCLHDGVLEIHVWDLVTGETRSSHSAKTSFSAYKLTFSPDGRTLLGAASVRDFDGGFAGGPHAVDSPARIELVDLMTARPRYHIEGFTAPALSPDGKVLAAARFDRLQLFDARTGKPLKKYAGHDAPVQKVAVSRDGRRFASVGHDHTICYWDAATGDLLSQRHVTDGIGDASFSGDLTSVAVLHGALKNNKHRRVTVWRNASDKPPFDLAMPDGDRLVALSADGNTVAAWGKDDLRVWNLASGAKPVKIASPGSPLGFGELILSDDGRRVIAGVSGESIQIWDTRTGKLKLELEPRGERQWDSFGGPFAISPDGRTLATHLDETIALYELMTGARVATLPLQTTGYFAELAFSPDGKLLASSARDGSVRLLAVSTGNVLADFQTHAAAWTSIAFSPDGNRLLSGGEAAVLELRDIGSLRGAARREAVRAQPAEDSRGATSPQKAAPESTDFEPLFRHIDDAREFGKLLKSSVAGGGGGGPFESKLDEPTLLIGFDYTLSTFYGGHLTVKSLRPIYMTRNGEKLGKWHGVRHGKVRRVKGKEGYVVTAIVAKHGHRLDGMRLLLMRVKDGRLNPDDTYRSKWIGGQGGGRATLHATYGNPVVSIFGRQGSDLDALGFIQVDTK